MQKILNRVLIICAFVFVVGAARAECTTDQYAVGDNCYSCPANATCDGETFTCNAGFYQNSGICSLCPIANSTCTSETDFSCNPGTYLYYGACATCPDNATCAGGNAPYKCNDGYFNNSASCTVCDPNRAVCADGKLVGCLAGYFYYSQDGINCNRCETGAYCPDGTTQTTIVCHEGYYNKGYHCFTCPAQYYCPDKTTNQNNYTQYCAAGYYHNGDCVPCPDGAVCPGDKTKECPAGLFWHDDGVCRDYQQGTPGTYPNCNPGFYNNGSECAPCIDNSTCISATEFTCNGGYYKNGNECSLCPMYSTCPTGSEQINCYPGYWLTNSQCARCPHLHYCTDNIATPCPVYTDGSFDGLLPDDHTVISAPRAYTMWSIDDIHTSAKMCRVAGDIVISAPMGEYAIVAPFYNTQTASYYNTTKSWTSAHTGYYLTDLTMNQSRPYYKNIVPCTNGPENSYYTGPGAPESNNCPWQCDDRYYRDGNECKVCPDGMNCLGGTIVCPAGEYPDVNVCRTCTNKPEHSAYTGPGTPAGNDCAFTCDAGYYYDGTACAQCEPGYYCPGDNERHKCTNATYTDTSGAIQCTQCPVDTGIYADKLLWYGYWNADNIHNDVSGCQAWYDTPLNQGKTTTLYTTWCHYQKYKHQYCGVGNVFYARDTDIKCDGGYYIAYHITDRGTIQCDSLECIQNMCQPVGEKYYSPANDIKRYECPARQTTTGYGVGADQAADCGVIWHIGGQEVRLRSERRTDPRFCVQINDDIFFADMTPVSEGAHGNIRIEVNGIVYSVYNADLQ